MISSLREECLYKNGNYVVIQYPDGTRKYRALRVGEDLVSEFPDSIDLKITNRCSIGCPYCHESSNPSGKSFNLERTIELLDKLPKVGIELAIGGGDVLDIANDLIELLGWAKKNKFLPRVTINSKSIKELADNKFPSIAPCNAFGISMDRFDLDFISDMSLSGKYSFIPHFESIKVYHLIAGVVPLDDLEKFLNVGEKILILGYKSWGRGKNIGPQISLKETSDLIKRYIFRLKNRGSDINTVLGFDNLAIEQLNIKDAFTEREWNMIYSGDEFTHSMYIDAVQEEFAHTSRDPRREPWGKYGNDIVRYFKESRKNDKTTD